MLSKWKIWREENSNGHRQNLRWSFDLINDRQMKDWHTTTIRSLQCLENAETRTTDLILYRRRYYVKDKNERTRTHLPSRGSHSSDRCNWIFHTKETNSVSRLVDVVSFLKTGKHCSAVKNTFWRRIDVKRLVVRSFCMLNWRFGRLLFSDRTRLYRCFFLLYLSTSEYWCLNGRRERERKTRSLIYQKKRKNSELWKKTQKNYLRWQCHFFIDLRRSCLGFVRYSSFFFFRWSLPVRILPQHNRCPTN